MSKNCMLISWICELQGIEPRLTVKLYTACCSCSGSMFIGLKFFQVCLKSPLSSLSHIHPTNTCSFGYSALYISAPLIAASLSSSYG